MLPLRTPETVSLPLLATSVSSSATSQTPALCGTGTRAGSAPGVRLTPALVNSRSCRIRVNFPGKSAFLLRGWPPCTPLQPWAGVVAGQVWMGVGASFLLISSTQFCPELCRLECRRWGRGDLTVPWVGPWNTETEFEDLEL